MHNEHFHNKPDNITYSNSFEHHKHQHHGLANLANKSDKNLVIAVILNLILTISQIVGGIISGSLALVADALHNLSDAASLGIAVFARRVANRPADEGKTFGYKRAELIAALINLTTLVIVGLYLVYEAIMRFIEPQHIAGWIIIVVAGIATVVNSATAYITYKAMDKSLNMKAAFAHNLSDTLASVAVIVAGVVIILYQWFWIDALLTLIIAGYVLYQGFSMLPQTIHILMEGTPENISFEKVVIDMKFIEPVKDVHDIHIWMLDEHHNALEAHVVVPKNLSIADIEPIKVSLKKMLDEKYGISHATLEFEYEGEQCI